MGESKFQINVNELEQPINPIVNKLKQEQTNARYEQIIKNQIRLPSLRQSCQIASKPHAEGIYTKHRSIIVKIVQ